ncbi:hypothetical protein [Streptomyces sp. NPDC058280]|uniref:hypothetical protein n=1 Tax=Streptomyces sp. NPDC058280 TaxID=3346419 RepID=UPI0036EC83E1
MKENHGRQLVVVAVRDYEYEEQDFKDGISQQVLSIENWITNPSVDPEMQFSMICPDRLLSTQDVRLFVHDERLFQRQGDALVVYITGHGIRSSAGRHFLILPESDEARLMSTAFPTADLVTTILDSEADHVLVIIDSCYSGSLDSELATYLQDLPPERYKSKDLAVVTSGDFNERPRIGEFTTVINLALAKMTDEASGFAAPNLSFRDWESVLREVEEERPDLISVNWVWPRNRGNTPSPCLPNPGYWSRIENSAKISQAIQVTSPTPSSYWIDRVSGRLGEDDAGWHFSGRKELLGGVRNFLTTGSGVCFVTGESGSGKSAILGYIVTSGYPPVTRDMSPAYKDMVDPSDSFIIDAAVLARNKSSDDLASELRRILQMHYLPEGGGSLSLEESVRQASSSLGRPLVVVVDGVDEALDPTGLARDVLAPLALSVKGDDPKSEKASDTKGVRLVLGVRSPRETSSGGDSLVHEIRRVIVNAESESLATEQVTDGTIDPEPKMPQEDHAQFMTIRTDGREAREEITSYVRELLLDESKDVTPYASRYIEAVAAATTIAGVVSPSFLDARLAADRARRASSIQDLHDSKWIETLQDGTIALLHADIREVAENSGISSSSLMTALRAVAFSLGSGMPWADVWPSVIDAIAGGSSHSADAAIRTIRESRLFGYLATGVSDERIVYRPMHERIAEELRSHTAGSEGSEHPSDIDQRQTHQAIAIALADRVRRQLPYPPHPYIRRHLVEHADLGGILDDQIIPLSFLKWESSRNIRRYLDPVAPRKTQDKLHAWARIESQVGEVDGSSQMASHAFHLRSIGGIPPPSDAWLSTRWANWKLRTDGSRSNAERSGLICALPDVGLAFTSEGLHSKRNDGVRVWDLHDGMSRGVIPASSVLEMCAYGNEHASLLFTYAGSGIGSGTGVVRVWDVVQRREVAAIPVGRIRQLRAFGRNLRGPLIAAISDDSGGAVSVWEIRSRSIMRTSEIPAGSLCTVGDSSLLVFSDPPNKNGFTHVWDARTGATLRSFQSGPVGSMAYATGARGENLIATSSSPHSQSTVKVWDIISGSLQREMNIGFVGTMCALSPANGRTALVTIGASNVLGLYDFWSGREIEKLILRAPVMNIAPIETGESAAPGFLIAGTAGFGALTLTR